MLPAVVVVEVYIYIYVCDEVVVVIRALVTVVQKGIQLREAIWADFCYSSLQKKKEQFSNPRFFLALRRRPLRMNCCDISLYFCKQSIG